MNKQEAQEILLLYRPGTTDADEPEVAAALECLTREPELAQWFEEHCELHDAIRAKVRQIPVPAGLKEQILSERRARDVIVWWRRPAILAAAACFVFLLAAAGAWLRPWEPDDFSAYRRLMVRTALRTYSTELETSDLNQIRSYLAQNNSHADCVLSQPLEKAVATGCVAMHWHGNRVAMLTFQSGQALDPGEKSDLFLFVIDRSSVPGFPQGEVIKVNKLMTASWSEGDKVYLLATHGDEDFVRKFR